MKLTMLILIAAILQANASAFAQKVTLSENKLPLNKIFERISEQTGYDFLVSTANLKRSKPVTITVKGEDLNIVLDKIFKDQPLSYVIQDKMIVISEKESKNSEKAEDRLLNPVAISGMVTDTTGSPLQGATIRIKNSERKTFTDRDGRFTINAEAGAEIEVSFIGYRSYTFSVDAVQKFLKIVLHASASSLNEVNVVSNGYQILPKERATGSFSQVDSTLISRRVSTDIISRLEGVVPGLLFNRNTSTSASGQTDISIRGTNTLFSNSQPLIVLDNFPYDGDINNINPNDIASITVLKDAAAASIWGVRSGNGVIVLTSKKGRQNQKLAIELNANVTIGAKPDVFYSPNFLDANDYIDIEQDLFKQGFYNPALTDPGQVVSPVVQILADQQAGTITPQAANAQIDALRAKDVRNDLSKYFYRKSVLQQYDLNFRGGGKQSDYFFSAGNDYSTSSQAGNSGNRFTLNGNYNFYPIKNLTLSAGIKYIQSASQNNSPVGNIYTGGHYYNSIFPYDQLADASGNALPIVRDYNYNLTSNSPPPGFLNWQFRPLDELNNADNQTHSLDNLLNFGASYQLIPGLSANVKYQYEKASVLVNDYYSTSTYYARNLINQYTQQNPDGTLTYPIPVGGILQQSNAYLTSQQIRAQLNYAKTFDQKNELNAIAGAEVRSAINSGESNTAYGYNKNTETNFTAIDYYDNFNLTPSDFGSSQIPNNLGFSKTTNNYVSYFSNAAYTYNSRYTLSVSGRIDKSNLFGVTTNQKAVPLYSTGFSWDLSKESFYHMDWFPYLKIRATYGYNANVNTSATAVTTLQQQSNSFYSGIPYDDIANPGNPNLRFEKVRMANFGLDYNTKNSIVSGSLEYYLKKTSDLFGSSPLPPSSGLNTFFGNTASTRGNGFDIVINTRNIYNANFKWTSNLLISHVLDKVTVYDAPTSVSGYLAAGSGNGGTITPLAGRPIYAIYSYRSGPLTHDSGDPQGYLNGKLSSDYTSIISNATVKDLYFDGPSRPTTFGSFRNSLVFKNWALSANIIFKLDYYFRRSSTGISEPAIVYGNVNKDYANRWQQPGDESHTSVPSVQAADNADRDNFYYYSQSLVDKADNIRLQDIRLSYDFIKRGASKLPFSHLQVYVYLNNVGILWRANHDHLDPDLFTNGNYTNTLPLTRTISIGIHSNF